MAPKTPGPGRLISRISPPWRALCHSREPGSRTSMLPRHNSHGKATMPDDLDDVTLPDDLDELDDTLEIEDVDGDADDLGDDDIDDPLAADTDDDLDTDDDIDANVEADIEEEEGTAETTERPSEESEGDEADEEDEEDVEASLDVILKERLVVVDDEPDDDEVTDVEDRSEMGERVLPKQPDEFVCRSCFLVKHPSQLADKDRMLCRDCV